MFSGVSVVWPCGREYKEGNPNYLIPEPVEEEKARLDAIVNDARMRVQEVQQALAAWTLAQLEASTAWQPPANMPADNEDDEDADT